MLKDFFLSRRQLACFASRNGPPWPPVASGLRLVVGVVLLAVVLRFRHGDGIGWVAFLFGLSGLVDGAEWLAQWKKSGSLQDILKKNGDEFIMKPTVRISSGKKSPLSGKP
ncbi:MAG: hypothetical protein H7832_06175 [Magnetococcus sp. DMHC-6]